MNILHWMLYSIAAVIMAGYLLTWLIALRATILIIFNADKYTVDPDDPESEKKSKGILRAMKPLQVTVVGFGEDYVYPVFNTSAAGYTVRGLEEGSPGMRRDVESDWDIIRSPENGIKPVIQSWYGCISPLYVLRLLVFKLTGRHLVRWFFPWITSGWWEVYKPVVREYERARDKGIKLRDHTWLMEQDKENPDLKLDNATVWNVADSTDHLMIRFTHEIIAPSYPNKSGLEFRAHFALVLEYTNLHRAFRWKNWSRRINQTIADAYGAYARPGGLESVYATSEGGVQTLQKLVETYLTDGAFNPTEYRYVMERQEDGSEKEVKEPMSVMEMLALNLNNVSLVDLIPANAETEKRVVEIMSIVPEATNLALKAELLLAGQAKVVKGLTQDEAKYLSDLVLAQQVGSAGKMDVILSPGGGGSSQNVESQIVTLLNKVVKNTEKEGGEK